MNIKNINSLSVIFLYLLMNFPTDTHATGDSFVRIALIPIAVNQNNVVLFKTKSHINKMGANTYAGLKFGWLVVSAKGVWEEAIHYEMHIDDNFDVLLRYDKNFIDRKDLNNPPDSLQLLIKKYHFEKAKILSPTQGNGQVIWSPYQFCHLKVCHSKRAEQLSLEGFKSLKNDGTSVSSTFFYAGIALFHNKSGYENEYYPDKNQGAVITDTVDSEAIVESTVADGITVLGQP